MKSIQPVCLANPFEIRNSYLTKKKSKQNGKGNDGPNAKKKDKNEGINTRLQMMFSDEQQNWNEDERDM